MAVTRTGRSSPFQAALCCAVVAAALALGSSPGRGATGDSDDKTACDRLSRQVAAVLEDRIDTGRMSEEEGLFVWDTVEVLHGRCRSPHARAVHRLLLRVLAYVETDAEAE